MNYTARGLDTAAEKLPCAKKAQKAIMPITTIA